MDHAVNVVVDHEPSNSERSITPASRCQHCGQHPVGWRPKREPIEYEPPNLRLLAIEKVKQLIVMSRLPQSEFATYAFGANVITITRYLRGERIPQDRLVHIHGIESIERQGSYLTTVTRICAERKRWHTMERKRELSLAPWLTNICRES